MNLNFRKLEHTIVGTADGKPFSVANTTDNLLQLISLQEDADAKAKDVLLWARATRNMAVAGSNEYLLHNPITGKYYLQHDGVRSKNVIPKVLVDFIEQSFDKNIDFMPVIKAWARFLANPRYTAEKGKLFANYLDSKFVDDDEVRDLMIRDEISREEAEKICTYQDLAITQEGLLATYKVAKMVTWKYIMVWKDDAVGSDGPGAYVKVRNPRYKAIPAVIDEVTGNVITPGSFEKPEFLEDYLFTPAIWDCGDQFYSGDKLGYTYKVGEVQKLPKDARRNLGNTFGGGGLYIGGLNYVEGYGNSNTHTLCCFVNPGDILGFQSDGMAIRTDALMPNNVWDEELPMKGIYHSSDYDTLSGDRLDAIMHDAIGRGVDLAKEQAEITASRENRVMVPDELATRPVTEADAFPGPPPAAPSLDSGDE